MLLRCFEWWCTDHREKCSQIHSLSVGSIANTGLKIHRGNLRTNVRTDPRKRLIREDSISDVSRSENHKAKPRRDTRQEIRAEQTTRQKHALTCGDDRCNGQKDNQQRFWHIHNSRSRRDGSWGRRQFRWATTWTASSPSRENRIVIRRRTIHCKWSSRGREVLEITMTMEDERHQIYMTSQDAMNSDELFIQGGVPDPKLKCEMQRMIRMRFLHKSDRKILTEPQTHGLFFETYKWNRKSKA